MRKRYDKGQVPPETRKKISDSLKKRYAEKGTAGIGSPKGRRKPVGRPPGPKTEVERERHFESIDISKTIFDLMSCSDGNHNLPLTERPAARELKPEYIWDFTKLKGGNDLRNDKLQSLKFMILTLGNKSRSAMLLGRGRHSIGKWILQDAYYAECIEEIEEGIKDYVEGQLMRKIHNESEASIHFYLKTKAKDRGYVERVENINANFEGVEFNIIDPDKTADNIKQLKNKGADEEDN